MIVLDRGVFQVNDGEVVSIDVRATGAQTLFGVNFRIFDEDGLIQEQEPTLITMDKSQAHDPSFIQGARATDLSLLFNFNSNSGGRYDLTTTGDAGGESFDDFANQHSIMPAHILYTFHIV